MPCAMHWSAAFRLVAVSMLLGVALAASGCDEKTTDPSPRSSPAPNAAPPETGEAAPDLDGARDPRWADSLLKERPVAFVEPERPGPHPFLLLLHGLGGDGESLLPVLGESFEGVMAAPDGLVDSQGRRFWNATPACCDFDGRRPDDVAYLSAIIQSAVADHHVDPERVYVMGYSNGGFMAHRLACELGGRIAAIVSIAGTTPETLDCPHVPRVLQIHGTEDETVPYEGGAGRVVHQQAGARGSVVAWAKLGQCNTERTELRDLVPGLPGDETEVLRFSECSGGPIELWSLRGVGHRLVGLPALRPRALAFLGGRGDRL